MPRQVQQVVLVVPVQEQAAQQAQGQGQGQGWAAASPSAARTLAERMVRVLVTHSTSPVAREDRAQ